MYYGWVQLFLFGQMLLWFNLYHSRFHLTRIHQTAFYLLGLYALFWVKFNSFSIGYFTTNILMQYIVFVMIAVSIFNNKFEFKKALCLGFLLVFLNSFWWELFYHVYEIQIWFPHNLNVDWWLNRLPQWIRVTPVYFLGNNFKVTDWRPVKAGLVISFILTYVRFVYGVSEVWLHPIHRSIALALLILTIYNSEVINNNRDNQYD